LAAVLLGTTVLTAGCMGGGGGSQPQQSPEPSSDQVEKAVDASLHKEDMKDFIRTSVRTQAGSELLELALDTQDGQKLVSDAVKRALNSATGQQAIISKIGELMNDPAFKTQVQMAIKDTLQEMLAKGTAGQQQKQGGGQQGGGGGGSQGGGGSSGGGAGGGGGGS
jgi:hypothetical protein